MNYFEDQENPQEQGKDPDNLWNTLNYDSGCRDNPTDHLLCLDIYQPAIGDQSIPAYGDPTSRSDPNQYTNHLPTETPNRQIHLQPTFTTTPLRRRLVLLQRSIPHLSLYYPRNPSLPPHRIKKQLSSPFTFTVQSGGPITYLFECQCNRKWDVNGWAVGGNVVDLQGAPIVGLRVQLYGSLHGEIKEIVSLTGT